eukprot:CAMPEP_0117683202 /NCGR_PEP_ID=MMETSP0804-20121206/20226_1 /TAXON_ID=1074897 /ORGANISM="Tetraselmis astigmatica, Strain CCMP880" /LENGTH=175 /DNA_ID=CAMNT_0005493683 /DNA_START=191 /DNA_END=719 /DNA_ORIENTATION=+
MKIPGACILGRAQQALLLQPRLYAVCVELVVAGERHDLIPFLRLVKTHSAVQALRRGIALRSPPAPEQAGAVHLPPAWPLHCRTRVARVEVHRQLRQVRIGDRQPRRRDAEAVIQPKKDLIVILVEVTVNKGEAEVQQVQRRSTLPQRHEEVASGRLTALRDAGEQLQVPGSNCS